VVARSLVVEADVGSDVKVGVGVGVGSRTQPTSSKSHREDLVVGSTNDEEPGSDLVLVSEGRDEDASSEVVPDDLPGPAEVAGSEVVVGLSLVVGLPGVVVGWSKVVVGWSEVVVGLSGVVVGLSGVVVGLSGVVVGLSGVVVGLPGLSDAVVDASDVRKVVVGSSVVDGASEVLVDV
jgi:hypothetical protein